MSAAKETPLQWAAAIAFVIVFMVFLAWVTGDDSGDEGPASGPATSAAACESVRGLAVPDSEVRSVCETSFDDCQLHGAEALAQRYGGPPDDVQGITIGYADAHFGSSGTESKVAARRGCRLGIEASR
ncbi:MAG: hypothetical protein M0P31_16965 [Solirubrobacteraceae bacterium]|nr:hypothetical protein [Solirubrobacteraceae bacterium]